MKMNRYCPNPNLNTEFRLLEEEGAPSESVPVDPIVGKSQTSGSLIRTKQEHHLPRRIRCCNCDHDKLMDEVLAIEKHWQDCMKRIRKKKKQIVIRIIELLNTNESVK